MVNPLQFVLRLFQAKITVQQFTLMRVDHVPHSIFWLKLYVLLLQLWKDIKGPGGNIEVKQNILCGWSWYTLAKVYTPGHSFLQHLRTNNYFVVQINAL